MVDAPAGGNKVVTVDCATVTPAATIMTDDADFKFTPASATISVGSAVKFVMSGSHDVVPNTGQDAGLNVGLGQTACLKFTAAGTYSFHCGPHGFQGSVTVQ
jgi:plastocyanin